MSLTKIKNIGGYELCSSLADVKLHVNYSNIGWNKRTGETKISLCKSSVLDQASLSVVSFSVSPGTLNVCIALIAYGNCSGTNCPVV